MPVPPPTNALTDVEWCGAMNGGDVISGRALVSSPATEWIAVTSSASDSVSGGRIPGRRCASIVFPIPGGPVNMM